MKRLVFSTLILLHLAAPSFADEEKSIAALRKLYQRPDHIPYLAENAYSKEREKLGWQLFFDPRLSKSGVMSCATCHNPSFSWGDGLMKGVGQAHMPLGRRTPTILNLAWTDKMMWDGRFSRLENQALGPISSEAEMNMDLNTLIDRLRLIPGYVELFEEAYPDEALSKELVGKALAVFERGIVSGEAPFDRWLKGDDNALSREALNGFLLFNGKAGCAKCHESWRFTDDSFHDIGLKSSDVGRGKYLALQSQQHAFKTPGLRNIVLRAPYMHDGSEASLMDVIDFYDRGGDMKRDSLSDLIKPLQLRPDEKQQILAFLKSLTSFDKPIQLPLLPR